MQHSDIPLAAARRLAGSWNNGKHIDALPAECRPAGRAEGYAIQALWPGVLGQAVAGWKIAATSVAGQQHIAVSGPIAGPVFAHRVHEDGTRIALDANRMRVAECEIVFRFGRALAPRASRYEREEVLAAVASLHPGIEVPDSRFLQFERAGEAQLIADCACTNDLLAGYDRDRSDAGARGDELAHLEGLPRVAQLVDQPHQRIDRIAQHVAALPLRAALTRTA